jgi:hypothetical protein
MYKMELNSTISKNFGSKRAAGKMLSLFLSAILLTSLFSFKVSAAEFPAIAGSDTINIGIISDTHISRSDSASSKTTEALLHNCLQELNAAASNSLDAVGVVGDLILIPGRCCISRAVRQAEANIMI